MATNFADLEISLHRYGVNAYALEFRYSQPDSDAETRLGQKPDGGPVLACIDQAALAQLRIDPLAYGKALTEGLFADAEARQALAEARANAFGLGAVLRLRLFIGPGATELHNIRWETLIDPLEGGSLCTNANLLFSRYLSSPDWRPVQIRSKSSLEALTVIANPSNLGEYHLSAIDVAAEQARLQSSLRFDTNRDKLSVASLPGRGQNSVLRATLGNLFAHLRQKPVDILVVVCHGSLVNGEAWLWLENDDGKVARASGHEFITRMRELTQVPRLVVLAACESAGKDTGDALAAIGPRLAEAGIPAVIAMQGSISIETASQFIQTFFSRLQEDGQIDQAMAVARGAVRHRPDFWMPALFMRLKSGRIWYVPGFGHETDEFDKWNTVKESILDKSCTPIIGAGLAELWLGRQSEIASRWADKHGYPLSPYEQESLPRIAQYITRSDSPDSLRKAYRSAVRDELLRRYKGVLTDELVNSEVWSPDKVLKALDLAAESCWENNCLEAHRQLAELRLPVYITTSPGNLLAHALTKVNGVKPIERMCPWWKSTVPKDKWYYDDEPSEDAPLVYYLFGHISVPESMVVSEDNYFDFLIGITRNKEQIPEVVRARLSSSPLLFLGFGIDDWSFRVVFRTLMAQENSSQLKEYRHVAAQIEPDETRLRDPRRARRYLERFFEGEKISIFWGQADEFMDKLSQTLAPATPSLIKAGE